MDISAWTDQQLLDHGWTPEGIQYYRSLNTPREADNWYEDISAAKSVVNPNKRKIVLVVLALVLIAAFFSFWG